jgi:hypothetical protein
MFCDFLLTFFSLKNDLNVPSKSRKTFYFSFFRVLKVSDENNRIRVRIQIQIRIRPLVRGMDPRIRTRIHTKIMSWIRNTDCYGSGYAWTWHSRGSEPVVTKLCGIRIPID